MNVLVTFTEIISDNYQGGSGNVFDRQVIMALDGAVMLDKVLSHVEKRLRDHSPVFYDVNDRERIVVRSVQILS
jgi:hypothetical protein